MLDPLPDAGGPFSEGAAAFLAFLCANPSGTDVALAVVHGPLRPLGAHAAAIYEASSPEDLSLIGTFGMPEVTWQRYSSISVAAPLTTCRTFRENRVILRSGSESGSWFSEDERELLRRSLSAPTGQMPTIITAPLSVKGLPIGVLAVHCAERGELSATESAQVHGASSALALWLYMRQISEQAHVRHPVPEPSPHVRITERQVRILGLIAEGRSAREIGETLQYSESTVKKDIMGLLAFLNVRDREAAVARARDIGLLL